MLHRYIEILQARFSRVFPREAGLCSRDLGSVVSVVSNVGNNVVHDLVVDRSRTATCAPRVVVPEWALQ